MTPDDGTRCTTLAARLAALLRDEAERAAVADVRIGLGYTAVLLADGRAGLAYTFRDLAQGGCSVFRGARPLAGRPAADVLPYVESPDAIEAAVGLACANALANQEGLACVEGDILEHLHLGSDDRVGMVGHFGPLVEPIQKVACSLTIFERVDRPSGILRPQEEAETTLPSCHVALITATALINRTIDGLLDAARDCRDVVVLGASTPLVPAAFAAARVTLLSGVVVQDADAVLRVVSEGGGMREFGRHVRKVVMRTTAPARR